MNKTTRQNLYIALTYSITLIAGMFLGYKFLKDQGYIIQKTSAVSANHTAKVEEIIHLIDKNYVDEVNIDTLSHLPIDSLLHQLDPHSNYLPPDKATAQQESLEGNFEGIGIEYYILNDTLLVTNVVRDGPAYSAGVKVGDRILKIDQVKVSGQKLAKADMIGKIKGKKGTPVQLVMLRPGGIKPLMLSIKRGKVRVSSIDASYMLNPATGYIRISRFGANTDLEFRDSLAVLMNKGMTKLVLDLRDNGGGYLSAATGLANQFFAENELIVYTEGKHEPRTDYIATGGGLFERGKLAVLINENTASASEILAGAVQDLDRGVIIGRRSFGKGLVQEQFPFGDGSALNLTIARYYTPRGRSIQKSYKEGYAAYQHEVDERFDEDELTGVKKIKKLKPKEIDGGGIHPDIYVKMDTAGTNKFYQNLLTQKILFDFVYDVLGTKYQQQYLEKNISNFSISTSDFSLFIKYLERKKITIDYLQLQAAKMVISNDLRVLLYKYHLGDAGYFKALNQHDQTIKQALTSLK